MQAVLISIQPKWCEKIASGEKTVEVRKTRPKIKTPFKCYIYMTSGNASYPVMKNGAPYMCHNNGGKVVIGEFVCDKITFTSMWRLLGKTGQCAKRTEDEENFPQLSCLTLDEIGDYAGSEHRILYGWHISDLAIYDEPKPLSEFIKPCENDLYCESCAMHSEFSGKCGNKALVISRPPQSWCYVEVCDD